MTISFLSTLFCFFPVKDEPVLIGVVGPPIQGTKLYDEKWNELKQYLPMLEQAIDKLTKENPRAFTFFSVFFPLFESRSFFWWNFFFFFFLLLFSSIFGHFLCLRCSERTDPLNRIGLLRSVAAHNVVQWETLSKCVDVIRRSKTWVCPIRLSSIQGSLRIFILFFTAFKMASRNIYTPKKVARSGQKWPEVAKTGQKWSKLARSGQNWPEVTKSGQKWPKVARILRRFKESKLLIVKNHRGTH